MTLSKRKLQEKDYDIAFRDMGKRCKSHSRFLKEKDRLELKAEIPNYFKLVEAYLWLDNQQVIGFQEPMSKI